MIATQPINGQTVGPVRILAAVLQQVVCVLHLPDQLYVFLSFMQGCCAVSRQTGCVLLMMFLRGCYADRLLALYACLICRQAVYCF